MKIKNSFFTIILLHFFFSGHSQNVDDALRKFPAFIVSRVYDLTTKCKLPKNRQLEIAKYFQQQDNLGNSALSRGDSVSKVSRYYLNDEQSLSQILTPLELNDFVFNTTNENFKNKAYLSKFAYALRFRNEINLTEAQIKSLLEQSAESAKLKRDTNFDSKQFELTVISSILDKKQYSAFSVFINQNIALEKVQSNWVQFKQWKVDRTTDSLKFFAMDLPYETKKLTGQSAQPPFPVLKLQAFNGTAPRSQFLTVMRYRKVVDLSEAQIDSVVSSMVILEKMKSAYRIQHPDGSLKSSVYEGQTLQRILSDAQYENYLKAKCNDSAVQKALADWDKLKEYSLGANLDKEKLVKDFTQYELRLMVINERLGVNNNQKNLMEKRSIIENQPEILKGLAEAIKVQGNKDKF